jgi:hypothetical protein
LVTFAARSWKPAAARAEIPLISLAHIITPAPTDDAAEIQTLLQQLLSQKVQTALDYYLFHQTHMP